MTSDFANCVALESTVISHGLPYPHNLETALAMEEIVAAEAAIPPRSVLSPVRSSSALAGSRLNIWRQRRASANKPS